MPRMSYQYGTSPKKYEPEYTPRKTTQKTSKKNTLKKVDTKKSDAKKRIEKQKMKRVQDRKNKTLQLVAVFAVFGMLLAVSYREIAIMELFNQKENLENQLSIIQKENGQVEKNIREVESKLNWNDIMTTAKEELGMQQKTAIPLDLEKEDNVETSNKLITEESTGILENIIAYFINK